MTALIVQPVLTASGAIVRASLTFPGILLYFILRVAAAILRLLGGLSFLPAKRRSSQHVLKIRLIRPIVGWTSLFQTPAAQSIQALFALGQ